MTGNACKLYWQVESQLLAGHVRVWACEVLGESIYEKKYGQLEQIVTNDFLMVFICIGVAEQHSKNRGKSNVQKYIFFTFKVY